MYDSRARVTSVLFQLGNLLDWKRLQNRLGSAAGAMTIPTIFHLVHMEAEYFNSHSRFSSDQQRLHVVLIDLKLQAFQIPTGTEHLKLTPGFTDYSKAAVELTKIASRMAQGKIYTISIQDALVVILEMHDRLRVFFPDMIAYWQEIRERLLLLDDRATSLLRELEKSALITQVTSSAVSTRLPYDLESSCELGLRIVEQSGASFPTSS